VRGVDSQQGSLRLSAESVQREIDDSAAETASIWDSEALVSQMQDEAAALEGELRAVDGDVRSLDAEGVRFADAAHRAEAESLQVEEQIRAVESDVAEMQRRQGRASEAIELAEGEVLLLAAQSARAELELGRAQRERADSEEKRAALGARVAQFREQLRAAGATGVAASERRGQAMRDLAASIIASDNEERAELSRQREDLAAEIAAHDQKFQIDSRELAAMISEAINDGEQLKVREERAPEVIQKVAEDVKCQADAMRARYEASKTMTETASARAWPGSWRRPRGSATTPRTAGGRSESRASK